MENIVLKDKGGRIKEEVGRRKDKGGRRKEEGNNKTMVIFKVFAARSPGFVKKGIIQKNICVKYLLKNNWLNRMFRGWE